MENIFFGEKDSFAIELADLNYDGLKGKIRFWIKGEAVGDFKKTLTLKPAIKSIQRLIEDKNALYHADFENKSPEQVFAICSFAGKKLEELTQEDLKKAEQFQRFTFYFGDQLDNVSNLILFRGNYYHFIWSTNNDYSGKAINYLKNLKSAALPFDQVGDASEALLQHFKKKTSQRLA